MTRGYLSIPTSRPASTFIILVVNHTLKPKTFDKLSVLGIVLMSHSCYSLSFPWNQTRILIASVRTFLLCSLQIPSYYSFKYIWFSRSLTKHFNMYCLSLSVSKNHRLQSGPVHFPDLIFHSHTAMVISIFLFLRHGKFVPTSGPLCLLFFLPGSTFLLFVHIWLQLII